MVGLGTIINVGAIILGLLLGRSVKVRYQDILMMAVGICVMMLGIGGTMEEMLSIQEGAIVSGGSMMMIITMALGALTGEWMDIEGKMEKFGTWLKEKTGSGGDNSLVDAFVTTSLTVCIGAMAVVGFIKDGIYGDYGILAAKAILDLIIVFVMTVSMGKGCVFSAIPVGIFQGIVTLPGTAAGAFDDRGGSIQSILGRVYHDLLRGAESCFWKEGKGGEFPTGDRVCGGMGIFTVKIG